MPDQTFTAGDAVTHYRRGGEYTIIRIYGFDGMLRADIRPTDGSYYPSVGIPVENLRAA